MVFEVIVPSSDESAFQALGAATMNALSAVRVLVLGMTKYPLVSNYKRYQTDELASKTGNDVSDSDVSGETDTGGQLL